MSPRMTNSVKTDYEWRFSKTFLVT